MTRIPASVLEHLRIPLVCGFIGLVACWLALPLHAAEDAAANAPRHEDISKLESEHKTPEESRGLAIYEKQFLQDVGWHSLEVQMDMLLVDAAGHESHRKLVRREIEDPVIPDKTLGVFLEPADVRGTVMLTFEQSYGSDEQWLYLPSLKRTKKINAENKSGAFLGTEFSWEDIATRELTKYHYRYVRDDGNDWVVVRVPAYQFSGYSQQITWVDKNNYQTVKIEYYDKKGDLLKTQVLDQWEQYNGHYWRARRQEMTNQVNHKKTVMQMSPYRMDIGLDRTKFSSLALDQIQPTEFNAAGR
jgi:hypothetical protein